MMNTTMDIEDYLQMMGTLVERRLDFLVPHNHDEHHQLYEAARYSLLGSGKRLRPILALTIVSAMNGPVETALSAACTLEIVHTYSLIHDDLPCMDDDDFRRGKPSLHKRYSEGIAVLTGDFLLTYAFELITNDPYLTAEQKVRLVSILAKSCGGEGMVGGQFLDIAADGSKIDLDHLRLIHSKKTGALITGSLEFGGVLAGADEEKMVILREIGQDLGLAFQIIDDILDVTSSSVKHGKAVGSDATNNKTTYITLMGLERSKQCAEELYHSAMGRLDSLEADTTFLANLATYILNRKF